MADATKPTDVDIMMFLDGELHGDEAKAVERYLAESDDASEVAESLAQIGALVQGSVELAADAAEDKLSGLWGGIERAISANGVSKEEAPVIPLHERASQKNAEEKGTQELVLRAGWFGGWQSHAVIGSFAAIAAALVMYVTTTGKAEETAAPAPAIIAKSLPSEPTPTIVPVALRSQEPEVEALEVYDGSGVIMTVPADDESDEAATTVIWITSDDDVAADPI